MFHIRIRRFASLAGTVVLLQAACGILGPDGERVIGSLYPDLEQGPWDPPAEVLAGSSFLVTIMTGGSNGCWEKDDTEIVRQGTVYTITPYDIRPTGERMCPNNVPVFEHVARITAAGPGTLTLRLRGRSTDGIITLEHQVTVTEN
ncbi:MAG: hypothetical protein ACRELV_09335 [Longimicrobiales bacterium]